MFELCCSLALFLFVMAALMECLVAWRFRDLTPLIWAATAMAAAAFPARELHILTINWTGLVLGLSLFASVLAAWRAAFKAFP